MGQKPNPKIRESRPKTRIGSQTTVQAMMLALNHREPVWVRYSLCGLEGYSH
jgi:hypothetical protein